MARGGFGSPTIFIDKTDMYFGNDRMPLIREALHASQGERGLMPKAVVCRELGPPESLRLETFASRRWRRAGARRRSCRRDQLSRHIDGGGRVPAQAAAAVHTRRRGRRARSSRSMRADERARSATAVIVKMRHGGLCRRGRRRGVAARRRCRRPSTMPRARRFSPRTARRITR